MTEHVHGCGHEDRLQVDARFGGVGYGLQSLDQLDGFEGGYGADASEVIGVLFGAAMASGQIASSGLKVGPVAEGQGCKEEKRG